MGLRFRKSISIIPGVRLNFGKTGMSVSAGVPGFRKTIHTSGKVTTSIGLPGTGLSYVTTDNLNKRSSEQNHIHTTDSVNRTVDVQDYVEAPTSVQPTRSESYQIRSINVDNIKSIHKTCDETVDWTEILVNPTPTDELYNKELWAYLHSVAQDVLNGDIDTYLRLIYKLNPLDDLLDFGVGFEFGTDDHRKIEVEFSVKSDELMPLKSNVGNSEYFNLFQDYICSCTIRVARDMFALLPVKNVIVHAVDDGKTILSITFDRQTMSKMKFGFIDPSNAVKRFEHNMNFNLERGFKPVEQMT